MELLVDADVGRLCEQVDSNGSQRNFQFNVVFEPDAMQEDVFENCGIKKLVDNAVLGYVTVCRGDRLIRRLLVSSSSSLSVSLLLSKIVVVLLILHT